MMHSDSFSSSSGIPPYLRAHARRSYSPIRGQQEGEDARGNGSRAYLLRRLVGAIVVCVAFGAAVSSSSGWIARGSTEQRPNAGGSPYRGVFEGFEERYSGTPAAEAGGGLNLVATNEYGEFDRKALALYGLEMLVEPFRETRITASNLEGALLGGRFYWLLVRADQSGSPLEGADAQVDARAGPFATVTLTDAGEQYALLVQQTRADGSVVAEKRVTITCKYVRRELRDLTEADLTAYFLAMREFYTVPLEEGRAKYGAAFYNAKHVAAYHNSVDYCYHNGMHFLTAHASFDLWVENNLQKIDPKVSLAFWDFMLDAAHLGTDWGSSEIFSPNMFGSASGSLENQHQISDGWFAGIQSIYDKGEEFLSDDVFISTVHNPHGLVDSPYDYQALPGVIRTNSYCGLESASELTKCGVFVGCFEDSTNFHDWSTCMEQSVHASVHGMIGGGFDCNVDMVEFAQENPQFNPGLLSFVLEYLLANRWPSNSLMDDYNTCDEDCDIDQSEPCGCTCNTNPVEWTDDEVYDFMEPVFKSLQIRSHGEMYVDEDDTAVHALGFAQDGVRLDEDSIMLLLRHMMMIGCEPNKVGAMSTGVAPLDPIFWVLHIIFEKAQHIVQLSPGYRDTYDFEWVDSGSCDEDSYGGKLNDPYPFTELMLGLGDSTELLTNAGILELLHPTNPKVTYLYDRFEKWGTCTDWDPCPECTDAVEGR